MSTLALACLDLRGLWKSGFLIFNFPTGSHWSKRSPLLCHLLNVSPSFGPALRPLSQAWEPQTAGGRKVQKVSWGQSTQTGWGGRQRINRDVWIGVHGPVMKTSIVGHEGLHSMRVCATGRQHSRRWADVCTCSHSDPDEDGNWCWSRRNSVADSRVGEDQQLKLGLRAGQELPCHWWNFIFRCRPPLSLEGLQVQWEEEFALQDPVVLVWVLPTCLVQCRRHRRQRIDPWVRKVPWRRKWQPTLVFLPGESHGQRRLVGSSPWGRKESNVTEWLNTHQQRVDASDAGRER